MHIHEYQTWIQAWDQARTWDKTLPSHVMLHAIEELGEISKHVQMLEGYRDPKGKDPNLIRDELALEFSDLQVMLFKVAYLCGIDMEKAMQRGQAKADERFPNPEDGPADQLAYWQRFTDFMAQAGLTEPLPAAQEVPNRQPLDPSLND